MLFCDRTALDWIGEVYFRAWTDAAGSVQTVCFVYLL